MARRNHRRRRHRAFVALRMVVVLLLGLALAAPLEAADPGHGWSGSAVAGEQAPVRTCGHDCAGAILLLCDQHGSCTLTALRPSQRDPAAPIAIAAPMPARWALKPHLPAVLLHPPNRVAP